MLTDVVKNDFGMSKTSKAICMLALVLLAQTSIVHASGHCSEVNPNESKTVMFFVPDEQHSSFWRMSANFAKSVAKDLSINLQIITIENGMHNRLGFKELAKTTFEKQKKPDFIMTLIYGGGESDQLTQLEQYGVPYFTINTSLDKPLLEKIGRPREKFALWKGHISPEETLAGRNLLSDLATINHGETVAILAGSTLSLVNKHRVEGALELARQEFLNVVPPFYTRWTRESSKKAANALFHRVENIDILWTAGPDITLGALDVFLESKNDLVVGSFDWSKSNIDLIKNGLLDVAYGGHFMESGWALIMIYDYLHGMDFDSNPGNLIHSHLNKLDSSNVMQIEPLIMQEKWDDIDFREYAKCTSKTAQEYTFKLIN